MDKPLTPQEFTVATQSLSRLIQKKTRGAPFLYLNGAVRYSSIRFEVPLKLNDDVTIILIFQFTFIYYSNKNKATTRYVCS